MSPATPEDRDGRRRGAGASNGALEQCTQRLVAALTEPEAGDIEELLERIRDESEGNEPAARRWVAAVRAVQADGRLTDDEADAVVDDLAHASLGDAAAVDAELAELSRKLKPLHELHHANWEAYRARRHAAGEHPDGPRDSDSEPRYPDGMQGLMDAYAARFAERFSVHLESLGEPAMAAEHRADSRAHLLRMIRGLQALMKRAGDTPGGFRLSFTPPENVPLPPLLGPDIDPDAPEFEETLQGHTMQWLDAMSEKPALMTIPAVLAFATIGSFQNTDGDGTIWIRSVQLARGVGAIDRDLSWLALDRITGSMVHGESNDPYQMELREKMWDVEDEYGAVDESDPEAIASAPEAWRVLERALDRRVTMLKVRILRAAGEREMADQMEERPAEYDALIERMAELWEGGADPA